jgi:uncharacterized protein (DUF2236 family)
MTYRNPNWHEFEYVNLDSSIFGDGSIIRMCHGVWSVATGIGIRALLDQALSPLVLTGLLLSNPKLLQEPTARIMRTLLAMETVYWGTWREAITLTNHIGEMHARVHGKVGAAAGSIPSETVYSALDSRVQKWIIAGLIDATIGCHNIFMGRNLTTAEMDQLVREYCIVGALFGVKLKDRWNSYAEFSRYFQEMMSLQFRSFDEYANVIKSRYGADFEADPRAFLELTEEHRVLVLKHTLHPDNALAEILKPQWTNFVSGILTPSMRQVYKLSWTQRDADSFNCLIDLTRASMAKARIAEASAAIWTVSALLNPYAWWTIPCAVASAGLAGRTIHGPILYKPGKATGILVRA